MFDIIYHINSKVICVSLVIIHFFMFPNVSYAQEEITVKSMTEHTSDLSARTNQRYDFNGEACALIKVHYPKPGATFEGNIIGDVNYQSNEYWVYVSSGTKRLRIHLPDVPTIIAEFRDYGIAQTTSNTTYYLDFKFPESKIQTDFYGEAEFVIGSVLGPSLNIGTYIENFNIEMNVMLPMASEDLYWTHPSQPSIKATYKPSYQIGARIGYGIKTGKAFMATPQVGISFLKTAESVDAASTDEYASGAYCSSIVLALKLQYNLSKNFGISLTPEYNTHLMKSDGFNALTKVSDEISKWGNGIGVRISACVVF